MNSLEDIIQRCHQRHKNPLRQRRTVITPASYMGGLHHFTVYCAHRCLVDLYDLEQANISFMPIGRAPWHDRGPRGFKGKRFLRQQTLRDWAHTFWYRSWGIQVYTGTPSARDGAQWHDIHFKYDAICAAPDTVLVCIETLTSITANPLLTLSKSGGLRFSCRVQNYLHPSTDEAKQYIYKHTPLPENPYHRDVYLEILGEAGYSRWDARYEILLGNLLDPPIIAKETLFAAIDTLRAVLHQPAPPSQNKPILVSQPPVVPHTLGSYNLDLAKAAFLRRGFSYVQQENNVHYWTHPDSNVDGGDALLWEQDADVWVRAATPETGLPVEATRITDVWNDTGILPQTPTTGLLVSDKVLAVREGKLPPLAIKRPSPILHKPEETGLVYYRTLEESVVQMQRIFDSGARILGLITEAGVEGNYAAESYAFNDIAISLSTSDFLAERTAQHFEKRNLPSFARWKPRNYRWEQVKEVPVAERMATPFQHGNVCEDPVRCDTLEERGGNPGESICPQCPVYVECQQRGYLSQPTALKHAKVQVVSSVKLFMDPKRSKRVIEILEPVDNIERLCIVDEAEAYRMFPICHLQKNTLEKWRVDWQGSALGNFASILLNILERKNSLDDNVIRRVRAAVQAFEGQEEMLVQQMCQVNIAGRVVPREFVDDETGKPLSHFTIKFEVGASAYIPLDANAADRLTTKGLPVFELEAFELNEDMKIAMSMTQAIELGILDILTVENIRAFPTVYQDPNWTLWHQLKRFFAHYTRDADAPVLRTDTGIKFMVPPMLHPDVKRLLFISSMLSERDLHRAFPDEKIEVHRIKPTTWLQGNRVFQIRNGLYPRQTILNYDTDWLALGMSEIGQRFFLGIQAEIEKDPSVKHAIITNSPVIVHLQNIAAKENVCFVEGFKRIEVLEDTTFETADVIWIVGTPHWAPGAFWRRSQILFGNDEKPLCYDGEVEFSSYKDERVQYVYERHTAGLLLQIIGRVGLNRWSNKTVVLLTSVSLPNITDRSETLLFDWEDFEVAGGLDKLPETIATREQFETERDNLTAESGREKVEEVLGVSSSQANRILMKLRGGKPLRVPLREQIFSMLAKGEQKTSELIDAVEGHPGSIKNELKRLLDTGEIVKVRRSMYALPPVTDAEEK